MVHFLQERADVAANQSSTPGGMYYGIVLRVFCHTIAGWIRDVLTRLVAMALWDSCISYEATKRLS